MAPLAVVRWRVRSSPSSFITPDLLRSRPKCSPGGLQIEVPPLLLVGVEGVGCRVVEDPQRRSCDVAQLIDGLSGPPQRPLGVEGGVGGREHLALLHRISPNLRPGSSTVAGMDLSWFAAVMVCVSWSRSATTGVSLGDAGGAGRIVRELAHRAALLVRRVLCRGEATGRELDRTPTPEQAGANGPAGRVGSVASTPATGRRHLLVTDDEGALRALPAARCILSPGATRSRPRGLHRLVVATGGLDTCVGLATRRVGHDRCGHATP